MKRLSLFFNDLSLRTEIVSICLGVSVFSLLIASLALLSLDRISMKEALRDKLINQADIIGQSAASAIVFYDMDFAAKLLAGLGANPHIQNAALYSTDGTLFGSYTKPNMSDKAQILPTTEAPTPNLVYFTSTFLEVTRPCLLNKEQVGVITLRSDLTELANRLKYSILIFSGVLLAASLASWLLSWWGQHFIMRPVNALTVAARKVTEKGDYKLRVTYCGADELGTLANAFNAMLDQIQKTTTKLTLNEQELLKHRQHLEKLVAARTNDLETAMRELKDFAYIVSHDLKAPLRAISQLATWINEDYGATMPPEGQQQLALMSERVKRMHNLIDGILQYSRIGRVQEQRRPVDLNQVVSDTLHMLVPPPHIKVRVRGKLPVVQAEQVRMEQLFQNLISNAIKYMDKPQGEIVISATENKSGEDHFCRIVVADNGPGIEAKYHQKIFQIFQTLAPQTSNTDSTGIGLSLVKKIVELHGGTIEVESEPGKGCKFIFTLTV
jgi:signal transduction histidine kinase